MQLPSIETDGAVALGQKQSNVMPQQADVSELVQDGSFAIISQQPSARHFTKSKNQLALPFDELQVVNEQIQQECNIFEKRLNYIDKRLDEEVVPMKPISKDRTRVNRVGLGLDQVAAKHLKDSGSSQNLDQALAFRKERKSVDESHLLSAIDKRRASIAKNLKVQKLGQALGMRKNSLTQIRESALANYGSIPNLSGQQIKGSQSI